MLYRFPIVKHNRVVRGFNNHRKPKYKWLAKLLERLRLMKDDMEPVYLDSYETVDISDSDILNVYRIGMHKVMCGAPYKPPTRVYVGREYFHHLMNHKTVVALCEPIKMPFKIYGVEVVVTPYLEGFLPVWEPVGTEVR